MAIVGQFHLVTVHSIVASQLQWFQIPIEFGTSRFDVYRRLSGCWSIIDADGEKHWPLVYTCNKYI